MSEETDDQLIGIVAGVIVAFLAVLAAIIVFCVVCRRRIRKYPDDKAVATVTASRLPINFAGRSDVILTSAGTTRKLSNGSVPMYGSQSSPAAAMLLPPSGADPYDEDDLVKIASVSRNSSYRRAGDVLQRRQLPELPRIPVDSAGITCIVSRRSIIASDCLILERLRETGHSVLVLCFRRHNWRGIVFWVVQASVCEGVSSLLYMLNE